MSAPPYLFASHTVDPAAAANDTTIVAFAVRPVVVPLRPPRQTEAGLMLTAPLVLLDLETANGIVGHAYVFTHTSLVLRSVVQLMHDMLPLLGGQRLDPARNVATLHARLAAADTPGLVETALAGIAIALWDAQAKITGQPFEWMAAPALLQSAAYARFLAHAGLAEAVLGQPLGAPEGSGPGMGIVWNQAAIRQFSV